MRNVIGSFMATVQLNVNAFVHIERSTEALGVGRSGSRLPHILKCRP